MSPYIQDYDVYTDETFLHGSVAFGLGALICSPRRAEILESSISRLRSDLGYHGEIKWTKTSRGTLRFYREVVDAFFTDRFPRLSVLEVIKGNDWHLWAKSNEERFFKAYYVFLMRNIGPFSRYRVFPDERPLQKRYRWDRLHFLINRARRANWGIRRRNVRFLTPVDSRSFELLQLTDLLLGCATSAATSDAKNALKEQFAARRSTVPERRIRVESWTPRIGSAVPADPQILASASVSVTEPISR